MTPRLRICERDVGGRAACYVIAEAGVNHDGDPAMASRLVQHAAAAGADAVKFQMFCADEIASAAAGKAGYQVETTGDGTQREMLAALELPREAFADLKREAEAAGIDFLCTCYSETELDYLDSVGIGAFKFASAQLVELPLLRHAAGKGKPLLVSTGMATLGEVEQAVAAIRGAARTECPDLLLFQCTSSYPAPVDEVNLRAMDTLAEAFGVPVGFSDHTAGSTAAIGAVARGAAAVEKHLTHDPSASGPDHSSSLAPAEFASFVRALRDCEAALGEAAKVPTEAERGNASSMRRSLHAATALKAGTTIAREHLALRRPDVGLPPRALDDLVGKTARVDIAADTPLSHDLIAD